MSTPTAKTPGYGLYRGRVACDCLIQWLPVFEREAQERGIITGQLQITQLVGTAAASAGTHKGGAFDIWETDPRLVRLARKMGAPATWIRTKAQGFTPHTHGVLRGCPHNEPARYQITAVDAGYNGLGKGGMGGKDDGSPKPPPKRTWVQGIAWAKKRQDSRLVSKIRKAKSQIAKWRTQRKELGETK